MLYKYINVYTYAVYIIIIYIIRQRNNWIQLKRIIVFTTVYYALFIHMTTLLPDQKDAI